MEIEKLNRAMKAEIKKSDEAVVLVVGHLVPDLDLRQDITVVLRGGLKKLIRGLTRGVTQRVRSMENLVAEATDYCGIVSRERCARTYEAETTAERRGHGLYLENFESASRPRSRQERS